MFIERALNVAIPPTAGTVVVPARVPLLGFVPIASVTFRVLLVTRLLEASKMRTVTAGVIVASLSVLVGCTPKASFVGAGAALKVAVRDWALLPMLKVQGDVDPVQVVVPGDTKVPPHPANTEPGLGVTVSVPTASLLRAGEQGFPVQLKLLAPGLIPDPATVPVPVPAKLIVKSLLSLNAV